MSGDKIIYDTKQGKRYVDYKIRIKETKEAADDDSCTKYPNQQHKSFADCVDAFIVKETRSVFGFGLPFISGSNHTSEPIARLEKHEDTVKLLQSIATNYFGGIIYKPPACLPPCSVLSTSSEFLTEDSYDVHSIYLHFDDTVEVQTTVMAYDFASLLVEIGSSSGLWLGLSVVGLFDLLIVFVEKLWRRVQTAF